MTVYRLASTDSPGRYRVVNADLDPKPAVLPEDTILPSGEPHPHAGRALATRTNGEPKTWFDLGGFTAAVVERAPQSAQDRGFDDYMEETVLRPWFAVPTAADPSVSTSLHPHQLPRWQGRYAAAIARASNPWDLLYRAAGALG